MRHLTLSRQAQDRRYKARRKLFLFAHHECEIATDECLGRADQVHHVVNRSQAHWLVDDLRVFAASCSPCHRYVTENPAWARANGFTFRSLMFPDYDAADTTHAADGHVWVLDGELLAREEWVLAVTAGIITANHPYDAIGHRNGQPADNRLVNFTVIHEVGHA